MKTLVALFSLFASVTLHAAERPNVVIILTDDQGWGDLSINGFAACRECGNPCSKSKLRRSE